MSAAARHSALVVDDDTFASSVIARQLSALGIGRVATAASGTKAVATIREHGPFSLVLCDLLMPEMDGLEFLDHLVKAQPAAALIVISAQEPKVLRLAGDLARARGLRLLGSLPKPVALEELRRLVLSDGEPVAEAPKAVAPPPSVDELRKAIASGTLEVHVQPKVYIADGSLAGAEALARWLTPEGVRATPDVFIPLAERSGLIDDLTDLVLRRSLQSCGEWARQGVRTRIAINFSGATLGRKDLPETIVQMAQAYDVEPQQVIVEVTESAVLLDEALSVLARLRMRGVSLSIDDFGTGYSSLKQLRRLPISELKIDQSFTAGILTDPDAARIVESTILLAKDLGVLSTAAEGIEHDAQLKRLAALGCDCAQGYLIARPFPRGALPQWLRDSGRG